MESKDLIEQLNYSDERRYIEAKRGRSIDRSIVETVCAFSNEPSLNGGYILSGVEEKTSSPFPSYVTAGVKKPDKLQSDLSSQCACMFNAVVRPQIDIERIGDSNIVKVRALHIRVKNR